MDSIPKSASEASEHTITPAPPRRRSVRVQGGAAHPGRDKTAPAVVATALCFQERREGGNAPPFGGIICGVTALSSFRQRGLPQARAGTTSSSSGYVGVSSPLSSKSNLGDELKGRHVARRPRRRRCRRFRRLCGQCRWRVDRNIDSYLES